MPLKRDFKITDARRGAAITVRAIAGSAATEVAGLQDGVIKIRLRAVDADLPDANSELIAFLAAQLDIPVKHIEIVAGVNGRDKIISIEGLTTDQVEGALLADAAE
jgi:uncharacterized protein YggU (UPF0235/DUF167 family)